MKGDSLPGPFVGPRAWTGEQMRATDEWIHHLRDDELDELIVATHHAATRGGAVGALTREQFPLTAMQSTVAAWSQELAHGRGFVLVRGVPVDELTPADVELLYYGLGVHLGVPVSQNTNGDLLGHVRDTGADPADPSVRLYRTRAAQPFHTDGSDVVGLLCLRPARTGGASTIVSSWAVYNAMRERRPDLARLWFEPFSFDLYEQQNPGARGWFDTCIGTVLGDQLFTFYLRFYIEQAQRHPDVPRLTPEQVEFLDLLDALCRELRLDMDFRPGDVQWLANASIFHGRTAYDDDPAQPRHLLRLWLTFHANAPDGEGFLGVGSR
jgi:Taurine catabolism dioxygenase TauD, TfdA family